MKKIIKFKNRNEYAHYLKDKIHLKEIGQGSEGICYLSNNNEEVYKIITNPVEQYSIDKIITTYDLDNNLQYYIFPEELHILEDNTLIGYKTKYIKEKNIFEFKEVIKTNYDLNQINFDLLLKGYYNLLKETEILSDKNILIYDLEWNIYFTGKKLYGIDTCGYKKVDKDIHKTNKEKLEDAIKEIIETYIMFHDEDYDIIINEFNQEKDIPSYLRKVKTYNRK